MICSLTNTYVELPQLSALCSDGSYRGVEIEKNITLHQTKTAIVLDSLRDEMHTGDILLTSTLLNLSGAGLCSYSAYISVVGELLQRGIRVISILENFDSNEYDLDTFIKIKNLMKETQRTSGRIIARKQKEGIAKAHATGRYADRSFKPSDFPEFDSLYESYQEDGISKIEMAKRLSISRPTLDKLFARHEQEIRKEKSKCWKL